MTPEEIYYHYFIMLPKQKTGPLLDEFSDDPEKASIRHGEKIIRRLPLEGALAYMQKDEFPFMLLVTMCLSDCGADMFSDDYNHLGLDCRELNLECYGVSDKRSALHYLDQRAKGKLDLHHIYQFLCSMDWNDDLHTVDDIMAMLQNLDVLLQYVADQDTTMLTLSVGVEIAFDWVLEW